MFVSMCLYVVLLKSHYDYCMFLEVEWKTKKILIIEIH